MLRTGLSVTVWTLAGVATILAASGQIEFARWAGITDVRAYAVPAVLELVAVAFLLIGYRRARRGDSASTLWLLAALVGAFAVYTNIAHTGGKAGLVFGAASAITLVLWFVKLRDDYRQFQRRTGQATQPRPKLGALWLVAPRLSVRAWMIATRRRISTVDEAVGYAEVWRAVYEDARSARVGRRLARRTAWRSVAEVAGGTVTELPRTAEIAAVQVMQRPAGTPPAPATSVPSAPPAPAVAGPPASANEAVAASTPYGAVAASPSANGAAVAPAPYGAVAASPSANGAAVAPAPYGAVAAGATTTAPSAVHDRAPQSLAEPSLRDLVFAFLDQHAGLDPDVDESDEPYLSWSVAGALGESSDRVAPHVRAWLERLGPSVTRPAPSLPSLASGPNPR